MDSRPMTRSERKENWNKSYKEIKTKFPHVDSLNWDLALESDPKLFTSLLNDLLKAEGKRSRPGKRPTLDRNIAESEFAKIKALDFSDQPFPIAFKALTHGRSIRNICHKTGLDRSYVHRLLGGRNQEPITLPSFEAMEKIATAFGKEPSYFMEYRQAFILFALDRFLTDAPETSVLWFNKLRGAGKIKVR